MFRASIYSDLEWVNSLWHSSHLTWNFYPPSGVWKSCVISFSVVGENQGGKNDCPAGTEVVKNSVGCKCTLTEYLTNISDMAGHLGDVGSLPRQSGALSLGELWSTFLPLMIMFTSKRGFYTQGFALDFPILIQLILSINISIFFSTQILSLASLPGVEGGRGTTPSPPECLLL